MRKIVIAVFLIIWCRNLAFADTTNVDKGRELYLSYGCALCHGPNGQGDGIRSQEFKPAPTNFHKGFLHGDDRDSIKRSIQNGIKEDTSIMPAFDDMSPDELEGIVDYLQSLQKK